MGVRGVIRVGRELLRPGALPVWQQDSLIALFVVAVGLPLYLTGVYRVIPGTDHVGLWLRLVELAVLGGLVLCRRWVPGGLLLATLLLAADIAIGVSLPMVIMYTDFLYAATLYGSRRCARIMIGIAVLSPAVAMATLLMLAVQWRIALLLVLGSVSFVVIPIWWAATVRRQRDVAEAERANAEQVTRIAELDRRAAISVERARMARDLHDVIAGHLSAIAIQSEAALSMAQDPATERAVLESVRGNSVSALAEMRAMIGLLRDDDPGPTETTAPARLSDLDRLVESARASGMRVTVRSTVDDTALPAAVDLTAYRIAQEALTNTVKHAPGGRVRVDIDRRGGMLTVQVGNELPPGTGQDGHGLGLLTMRERADAVGGTLLAGPSGSDWIVRAELPVAEGPA